MHSLAKHKFSFLIATRNYKSNGILPSNTISVSKVAIWMVNMVLG